ncbi:hypothetical protein ACUNWD_09955 [Sunxiuqinia sp. A32]|uniref:hypothetical protein n=1 Tax=Sunxiuqinia sp. A32 TaxID=3461496 RepID=UPI0040468231
MKSLKTHDVIESRDTGELNIVPIRTPIEPVPFGDILRFTGSYAECERYVRKVLKKRYAKTA